MRRPRPVIAGGFYHIIQRGNFRQTLFWAEADYLRFQDSESNSPPYDDSQEVA